MIFGTTVKLKKLKNPTIKKIIFIFVLYVRSEIMDRPISGLNKLRVTHKTRYSSKGKRVIEYLVINSFYYSVTRENGPKSIKPTITLQI